MSPDILLTVVVTSTIQSLFGVGVLLFGTPLLLLFDSDFINALIVLLPISVSINLLQIIKHPAHIDVKFYKKILTYTIPFVVLFLFIVTRSNFNTGLAIRAFVILSFAIGVFLILVALKNFSARVATFIESLVRYEKGYFITMGIIHGLTNLGGSLLTAIIHSKNYEKGCRAGYDRCILRHIYWLSDSHTPPICQSARYPLLGKCYVHSSRGVDFSTDGQVDLRQDR